MGRAVWSVGLYRQTLEEMRVMGWGVSEGQLSRWEEVGRMLWDAERGDV
jgi:hypothetical protein